MRQVLIITMPVSQTTERLLICTALDLLEDVNST
jgi:hypothetical protein